MRGARWRLRGAGMLLVAVPLAGGLVAGLAPSAAAAGETITLEASRNPLQFGQNVDLSGDITPDPGPPQTVQIVDADDPSTVLATKETTTGGHYVTKLDEVPAENVRLIAQWLSDDPTPVVLAESEPLLLKVRPILIAKLTKPRLFDTVRVHGSIDPPQPGDQVEVKLLRAGKVVGAKKATLKDGARKYTATFLIRDTGKYRGKARFDDADHASAVDLSTRRRAPLPPKLSMGKTTIYTRLLEKRLRQLHYKTPPPDNKFDYRTSDAVVAFHKVQYMPRDRVVDAKTWRRLIHPIIPKPRAKKRPFHIEVDQTRQVLYVIKGGEIVSIVHTSTGAGGATHDGVFYVHRKVAGYSPNNLYYPSYFDGNRAVHGWPEVPTYPASHGCARVPYWNAIWLFKIMPLGTQVRVYHS